MLKHKTQPAAHVTPEFASSAWIAHNATMKHKRALLAGQKPEIGAGCKWQATTITPAVTAYCKRGLSRANKIKSIAAMVAFIAVMAFVSYAGAAAGY